MGMLDGMFDGMFDGIFDGNGRWNVRWNVSQSLRRCSNGVCRYSALESEKGVSLVVELKPAPAAGRSIDNVLRAGVVTVEVTFLSPAPVVAPPATSNP